MSEVRILHLVDNLKKGSGVMSFIMNVYKNIDRKKVQFDFLVALPSDGESFESDIIKLGGNIYKINIPNILKSFDFMKKVDLFFKQKKNVYKAIHSHTPTLNIFYFHYAKKYGIKNRITHSHSTKSSNSFLKRIRNFFLLIPLKNQSNIYLACSEEAANYLYGNKNCKNGNVTIVNNGIDTRKFAFNEEIRSKYRSELELENKYVIGHVGRFTKEKNHDFLIEVFYKFLKENNESVLLLVGDGELRGEIERKTIQLGIDKNVKYLGIRSDVNNLMQAMDVFILPSFFEGLGIVAIEAQTSGLKCFVSNKVPTAIDFMEGLVTFLNINEGPEYWAKMINIGKDIRQRKDSYLTIKNSGYDVKDTVKSLEEYYFNLNV